MLLLFSAGAALAKVSGTVELDYGHFDATEAGTKVVDATHFAQRYALYYEKSGVLLDGRAGSSQQGC